MDRDEMLRLMQEKADDPTAWVHNPMMMGPEDAAIWCSLSLTAISDMAEHIADHMIEDDEYMTAAEELGHVMMIAHQVTEIMGNKLLGADDRKEIMRRRIELQTGEPVDDIEFVNINGVTFLKTSHKEEIVPDDLSGLE